MTLLSKYELLTHAPCSLSTTPMIWMGLSPKSPAYIICPIAGSSPQLALANAFDTMPWVAKSGLPVNTSSS